MPRYYYIAKSHPQETVQGSIEAETEQEAINKLTKTGYFPVVIRPEALFLEKQSLFGIPKATSRDVFLFTGQLLNLVESGVNLIHSLGIISGSTTSKTLKIIIEDVITKIKDGKSLSDGLSAHPYLFSNLYTSMIRTGEATGNLKEILKNLNAFLEKEEEFKNSVRSALTYPAFVFGVGALTVFVLLVFVIPRLVTIFEDMNQVLPLPTRILINISDFLSRSGWLILAAVFPVVFIFRLQYRTRAGRIAWDGLKLKLAVFGQIILKSEISRMMRTMSLLLSSGIPITPSLEISSSVIENLVLKSEIAKFKELINNGLSLSETLKSSNIFPVMATSIIAIGEETGSLDKSLGRIADDYEKEIDRIVKNLTRLLEPVIILVMGLIVGFIVLSMLLPIFQINLIVR